MMKKHDTARTNNRLPTAADTHCLIVSLSMREQSMPLVGILLALLAACTPTVGANSPPEVVAPKPVAAAPEARPTIAERAARYDMIVQQAQPPSGAPAPAGSKDYVDGYPRLLPAPKARADGSLQSFMALDTGPYLTNSVVHNLTWTNDSGRRLAIFKAYLWTGVDKGGIADVVFEVRRTSDNSYIGVLQWDHYADPTLPQHGLQFDYPSPMMLDPGETITIKHFGNGFAPGWHAHHYLILWVK